MKEGVQGWSREEGGLNWGGMMRTLAEALRWDLVYLSRLRLQRQRWMLALIFGSWLLWMDGCVEKKAKDLFLVEDARRRLGAYFARQREGRYDTVAVLRIRVSTSIASQSTCP